MTATNLHPIEAVAEADPLEELADKADALMRKAMQPALIVSARAALNEAGLMRARKYLVDAVDLYDSALAAKRASYAAMRDAERRYTDAVAEAAYALDGRFVVEGNKTFLVDGDQRRAMTADERRDWKERQARRDPDVVVAGRDFAAAQSDHERCVDELHLAEMRFKASRIDVEASVAHVRILAEAIRPAGES